MSSYCVQVAQVAVDPATGQVRVLEILSAVDVGEIIHPLGHQMQIDGGAIMGYGFACLEDLAEDDGQVTAANLGEFRLPTMSDAPALRTVLVAGGRGVTAANIKPVGELTNVPVAAAVANAVADATGCRIRDLPVTAEKVYCGAAGGTAEVKLSFTLNGAAVDADIEPDLLLVDLIRDRGLTGTKEACGVGVCGLCTVLVNDLPVSSCLYLAACADGADVWTAEGLAREDPGLVQAFVEPGRNAVRDLHPRPGRGGGRAGPGESGRDRCGHTRAHVGQPVPVHRLPDHRRLGEDLP